MTVWIRRGPPALPTPLTRLALTTLAALAAALTGCATQTSRTGGVEASADAAFVYRCASGEVVEASYRRGGDTATVRYAGRIVLMHHAISADGARFAGGGIEWWTRGSSLGSPGTMFRHRADGSTGAVIETCALAVAPPQ